MHEWITVIIINLKLLWWIGELYSLVDGSAETLNIRSQIF